MRLDTYQRNVFHLNEDDFFYDVPRENSTLTLPSGAPMPLTPIEDRFLELRGQLGRRRPDPSWVGVPVFWFHVARFFALLVVIAIPVALLVILSQYGFTREIIIPLAIWLTAGTVALVLTFVLAKAAYRRALGYALDRARNSEQGWLMCRWLWVSYKLIRDDYRLLFRTLSPFFPSHENSIQFMLECLRDAASHAHTVAKLIRINHGNLRVDPRAALASAKTDDWTFTADQRFNDLVNTVIERTDQRKVGDDVVGGLFQRLTWWIEYPARGMVFLWIGGSICLFAWYLLSQEKHF